MRSRPSVTDVARNFADYINRVAFRGERFTLTRGGQAVAELTPVPRGRHVDELPALLASLPRLGEEEATAFDADLARARESLGDGELRDPWAS
jgi:antitoxin (DNA-binding transcriptional repressor) of toxin-antitoxin stability system